MYLTQREKVKKMMWLATRKRVRIKEMLHLARRRMKAKKMLLPLLQVQLTRKLCRVRNVSDM
uniref:Uncharacterized protein n=1 Tax=Arundo donax TaxID=35708 RepID=A0A0A9GCX6_ARUDO